MPLTLTLLLRFLRTRVDLSFLHKTYRDEYYYWDVVEIARKFILLMSRYAFELVSVIVKLIHIINSVGLADSGAVGVNLNVSILALSFHLQCRPYKRAFDHWMQTADLFGICLLYSRLSASSSSSCSPLCANTFAWVQFAYTCAFTIVSIFSLLSGVAHTVYEKCFCVPRRAVGYEQLDDDNIGLSAKK